MGILPENCLDLADIHKKGRFALIIPVYNHEQAVLEVVKQSFKLNIPIFVVDDGSTDSTYTKVLTIPGIRLLRHHENRGKGAAILTGFAEASKIADWVITLDADGQHNPEDALKLVQAIPENERPIMVGMREGMAGKNVPWTSRFGRKFSNFWVLVSGGPAMMDSQSGFRIYPVPEAMNLNLFSKRFQFEVEILVKAGWNHIPVIEVPIRVNYPSRAGRISHYHPFIDFLRNAQTFSRLITWRILIHPFGQKGTKAATKSCPPLD
jgi:glycosyltransferase involved in cell wall biosynthesis